MNWRLVDREDRPPGRIGKAGVTRFFCFRMLFAFATAIKLLQRWGSIQSPHTKHSP
jgi:hypothetical protein